ncbi:MAG TPA: LysR substrate-binding domain-containing protein, partial [Gemmatimonadaceae bacterium]|nr:LysR substrate-binding domain-containing protein [Gemmatimonadaceae bacterium]
LRLADSRGIVAAVAAGAGVAIVSSLVTRPFIDARRVVRVAIDGVEMRRAFSTIHRPGRSLATLDRALVQTLPAPSRP